MYHINKNIFVFVKKVKESLSPLATSFLFSELIFQKIILWKFCVIHLNMVKCFK